MPTDLLTTAQAAERLGKSVRTVHRMIVDERLKPTLKLPGLTGDYLFSAEDVDALREAS